MSTTIRTFGFERQAKLRSQNGEVLCLVSWGWAAYAAFKKQQKKKSPHGKNTSVYIPLAFPLVACPSPFAF